MKQRGKVMTTHMEREKVQRWFTWSKFKHNNERYYIVGQSSFENSCFIKNGVRH